MGKSLATMPPLVLHKVAERLDDYDRIAFASTCTAFRDAILEVVKGERKDSEENMKKFVMNLRTENFIRFPPCFSLDWFKWVHRSFDRRKGVAPAPEDPLRNDKPRQDLYDCDLMGLAAFQGSIEAMKWLRSQGVPLDIDHWAAGPQAATGGQIEVLKWLRSEGFRFDEGTCVGAAYGG